MTGAARALLVEDQRRVADDQFTAPSAVSTWTLPRVALN